MKKLLSIIVSIAMAAGVLSSGAQVLAADSAVMSPQGLVMWPKANWEARPTPIANGSENLVVGDVYDEQTGFYYRNYAGGCMIADGKIVFNDAGGINQTASEFSNYRWLGGANIDPVTFQMNPLMEYDLSDRGITQTNATDFIADKITIGEKLNSNLPAYFEKFTNLKNTELLTDGEYVRELFIKRINELAQGGNAIGVVYDDTNINVANYGGMISLNLRYSSFNGSIAGIVEVGKQAIVLNLYCDEGVNVSGEFYQEWNANYEAYGIPLENTRKVTINGVEYTVMEFENSAIVSDPTLPAQTIKINQGNPIAVFELPGTVCGVWKAELEQIINSAPSEQGGIPEAEWNEYLQILNAAKQINADDNAIQLQVHEAAEELSQAIADLPDVPEIINPESVTIAGAPEKMTVGDTANLSAEVLPADAADRSVTWTSLTPELAAVSEYGAVTALKAGTATIQVSTANSITATVDIEIQEKQEKVKDPADPTKPTDSGTNNKPGVSTSAVTNGTQVVNGKTVLYVNGKQVTDTKVVTVSGKTYAVVGGYVKTGKKQVVKIGSKYYIVNASGVVQKGTKNKLIKVGTKSYVVNKNGVVQRKASGNKLVKVGTKSYIVNKLGVVQKGTKNKLIEIGKKAYIVNKKGVVLKNKKSVKVGKKTYKTYKKGVAVRLK